MHTTDGGRVSNTQTEKEKDVPRHLGRAERRAKPREEESEEIKWITAGNNEQK